MSVYRRPRPAGLIALALTLISACGAPEDDVTPPLDGPLGAGASAGGPGSTDAAMANGGATTGADARPAPSEVIDAAARYAEQCASCHGSRGEGASGPPLTRPYQRDYLAEFIDARMPLGNPERCDRACAEALADYILVERFSAPPPACPDAVPPAVAPRALRLLTRRELLNTVSDLLGDASPRPELVALSRALPPESRPRGFGFETHGQATVVTSGHIEGWIALSDAVATWIQADAARYAPCLGEPDGPERFLADFGRRAFRRALAESEITRYSALWRSQPDDAEGLATVVMGLLNSPNFLYRSELGSRAAAAGARPLTGDEVASALSYGLWATMPDGSLFAAADSGRLSTAEGVTVEARRLLGDARARAQVGAFALQWLGLEGLAEREKRADLYPDWSRELAESMQQETRLAVQAAVLDGGGFDALMRGRETFVDARLAALYGLPGAFDETFQRVTLEADSGPAGSLRAGLVGHASVLTSTSHSDQTSPIRRGLFVRERLLCTVFGTPPPDAGGVPEVDPNATTRERFRQHTEQARCAACHRYIDSVGFGFEQFDAIGALRASEAGQSIDHHGDLTDVEGLGTATSAPFDDLPALGATLAESERARACFVTQLWRFQRGRFEATADACELSALSDALRDADGDVVELLVALMVRDALSPRVDAVEEVAE